MISGSLNAIFHDLHSSESGKTRFTQVVNTGYTTLPGDRESQEMDPDIIRYDNSRDFEKAMSVLSRLLAILVFALMSVVTNSVLPADVIIGNLSGDSTSIHSFYETSTMSLGVMTGVSSVTLTSVSLRLRAQDLSGAAGLMIYDDLSGNPGATLIADLGSKAVAGGSFADYLFTPVNQPILLANSKYWLTISTTITHPNSLLVAADSTLTPPAGSFATFLGLRFYDGSEITNLDGAQIPAFQISGGVGSVAVSEPAYFPLFAFVGGVIILLRRANGLAARSGAIVVS